MTHEVRRNELPNGQWKQPSVLLIDNDEKRQFERAAGMRRCGVMVDCVGDAAAAQELWRPESHQLILIEFRGAKDDLRTFCLHVQRTSPLQKIGFYRNSAPFIDSSLDASVPFAADKALPHVDAPQSPIGGTANMKLHKSGFMEVAQRIAVMRRRPAGTALQNGRSERPERESNASIAARVLGGGK